MRRIETLSDGSIVGYAAGNVWSIKATPNGYAAIPAYGWTVRCFTSPVAARSLTAMDNKLGKLEPLQSFCGGPHGESLRNRSHYRQAWTFAPYRRRKPYVCAI
jgi:hypothetical protein